MADISSKPTNGQTSLPMESTPEHLTINQLERWLWDAACATRGAADAPKFKDFILPLVFYKRLSEVYDDELAKKIEEFGDEETAQEIVEQDYAAAVVEGRDPIIRFYVPTECHWSKIRNHPADSTLGEFTTECFRNVQFVSVGEKVAHRPLAEILDDLDDARIKCERADALLSEVLIGLGLRGADPE